MLRQPKCDSVSGLTKSMCRSTQLLHLSRLKVVNNYLLHSSKRNARYHQSAVVVEHMCDPGMGSDGIWMGSLHVFLCSLGGACLPL